MIAPTQQKLRDKLITAKQWAEMVKSGDWINTGGPGADPTACVDALGARLGDGPGEVSNIEIWSQVNISTSRIVSKWDPEAKYCLYHEPFFLAGSRHWWDEYKSIDWSQWGWSAGMNYFYARWARRERSKAAMDWAITAVPKPEHGFVNFSYGVNNAMIAAKTCKKIVAEIRDDYAWCEPGRNILLPIDDVDYFVEVDLSNPLYLWPQIDERAYEPTEEEKIIAKHILSIMGDGDCLQVGIGGLPTAVVQEIRKAGLKHLGIHSEMIGEWAFTLIEAGCVDNSRKNIDPGRCVWNYAMPFDIERYKEFMHHNSFFAGYDIFYPNNILTLSKNDHAIGINSFIAMDLLGQDCCAFYEGRPISGTGGQFQFTVGCAMAKGGRGILAVTSRDKKAKSRFVPVFPSGTVIDVPSQFVSWVVTENGIVNLSGKTQYEKAHDIIHILAHPDDRAWLEGEAYKLNLIPKQFKLCPDRRYPDYWKDLRDYKHLYSSEMWGFDHIGDLWSGK
jgi:acyl-CoA hydrolase